LNVQAAADCLAHRRVRSSAFGANVRKAERIRDGESPDAVLGGPKVRAFYRAILGDASAVVVDSWMLRACGHGRDTCTEKQYRAYARELAHCARLVGCKPSEFQAIVWCHIRKGADNAIPSWGPREVPRALASECRSVHWAAVVRARYRVANRQIR
jgi:hypothetical protein